ncbi:indolepyruvate ferredoxin oxidoreductase subunit alpha [Candidatus Omnitrophota bacterium]
MAVTVDLEKCNGCGQCVEICPVSALKIENGKARVNKSECVDCENCVDECPQGALKL